MTPLEAIPFIFLLCNPTINSEVKKLGNDVFKVRQEASVKLEELDIKAIWVLSYAQFSEDVEIARRAEQILQNYYNKLPDYKDVRKIKDIEDEFIYDLAYEHLVKLSPLIRRDSTEREIAWNQVKEVWYKPKDRIISFYCRVAWKDERSFIINKINPKVSEFNIYKVATLYLMKDLLKWGVPKKQVLKIVLR